MIIAVADTHAVVWYLYGDNRLSERARNVIDDAAMNGDRVAVSAITLVEMVYLIERQRIASETLSLFANLLGDSVNVFTEYPVNLIIGRSLSRVDREQIPELPDRIVAATALHLGVPVISRDHKISGSAIDSVW